MGKIRVLIADDHPIFLEGICSAVKTRFPELDIVSAVSNGKEAVEKEAELDPDVVLLDIRMPVMDGVEAARLMKERRPDVKIIMLTTFNERELVLDAIEAGARGYVLKEASIADVVSDVKSVFRGNVLITEKAALELLWPQSKGQRKDDSMDTDTPSELGEFTQRERAVFQLLLRGKSNIQIAVDLCITEGTVRNYVSHIYDILGVHNRTAVVLWAFEHGVSQKYI